MAKSQLDDLRAMWRLRTFELLVKDLRLEGDVVGSVHLGVGQEALPVGTISALGPDDAVFATYRGHGWALACGVPPEALFAEMMGRSTGINGGRGGSAYFSAPKYRFFGENSIVGAGAPHAVGAALAGTYDGTNRVALTIFGDGAMNQGGIHESMNFAAARNLPVVFLCENNYWSEMTPIVEAVREQELYKRATGYGFPGVRIDGNSVAVVRRALATAVEHARSGNGPYLVEAMTARLVGHYIGDIEHYRRPGELDAATAVEPIVRLGEELTVQGVPASTLIEIEESVAREMAEAVARAKAAEPASHTTVKEHLYA
jgi:TPP-dependent pyruvate/acetoin dehydrogenase alpha subunit